MFLVRRLLDRLGFKPHLFRCPGGRHDWRHIYGDEINAVGARYLCRDCPATTNHPEGNHDD